MAKLPAATIGERRSFKMIMIGKIICENLNYHNYQRSFKKNNDLAAYATRSFCSFII